MSIGSIVGAAVAVNVLDGTSKSLMSKKKKKKCKKKKMMKF